MLRVCFNCYGNYTTDTVYQWDQNHVLHIIGLNLDYAPTVHFCNKKSTEAIVVQSKKEDDAIIVDVPNELLQEPYNIMAYIHTYDENHAKTIELINIPLVKRVKPSEYQFTENVEIMSFERLEKDFTDFINLVEADFLEFKEEANAHIDARIDDYVAKGYVNWENVLQKPGEFALLDSEDNAEVEIQEKMYTNSDTRDNVVNFTSGDGSGEEWSEVETLVSGEKHSSIFSKISTMFKNIRYLFTKLNAIALRVGYLDYCGENGEGLRANLPLNFDFNGTSYAVSNIQIPEGYIIDNDFPTIQATVNGCSVDGAPGMLRVERYHDSAIIVFLNDNYNGTLLLAIGVRLKRV